MALTMDDVLSLLPGDAEQRAAWGRSLARSPATILGAPVDLVNTGIGVLNALGGGKSPIRATEKPVMGSQWLAEQLGMPTEPGSPYADFAVGLAGPPAAIAAGRGMGSLIDAIAEARPGPMAGSPAAQIGAVGNVPSAPKPTAVGMINWNSMTPMQRQQAGLSGMHLRQGPDGQFIGAPRGINSQGQLDALRNRLYTQMNGIMSEPWASNSRWYQRQREGVLEAGGNDFRRQNNLSEGIGVYSPQSTPDVNGSWAMNAATRYALEGDAAPMVKTGAQARTLEPVLNGSQVDANLGSKTRPFANSSSPAKSDPYMSTNDLWQGRFFGYQGNDGRAFDRGFTPAEHGFIQGEMQRMTALANRGKWGGRSDWTTEELQALPWVKLKAQKIMDEHNAAKINADNPMTLDQAIEIANRTTLEALPRNTLNMTREIVPAIGSGHLEFLPGAPWEDRLAYTMNAGNGLDPTGRMVTWQANPYTLERPALQAVGEYTLKNPRTGVVTTENNPVLVNRLIGERIAGQGGKGHTFGDSTQRAAQVEAALSGAMDVQNMAGYSTLFPEGKKATASLLDSLLVDAPNTVTLNQIKAIAQPRGLDPIHYGDGQFGLVNWGGAGRVTPKTAEDIARSLPGANVNRAQKFAGNVDYSNEWGAGEGSGAVTRKLVDILTQPGNERQIGFIDQSPAFRQDLLDKIARDDAFASLGFGRARPDVQKLRQDVANTGLMDLIKRVTAGGAAGYPAYLGFDLLRGASGDQPSYGLQ